jgi:hypothetical protein
MALNKFIPLSPDPNITRDSDMGMAQFGHLNTIVDYLNGTNALGDLKLDGTLFFNSYSGGEASIIITHSRYNQNPLTYIGGGATLIVGGYYSQYLSTPYNQGYGNTVLGIYASIIAHDNSYFNTVIGYGASVTINEPGNVIMGYGATSSVANATAIGRQTNVSGYNGTAIGIQARTTTTNGFALGNSSALLQIGGNFVPTARVHVKGLGATSATTSLLVQNSAGVTSTEIQDDGTLRQYRQAFFQNNSGILSFASDRISMQAYTSFFLKYRAVNLFEIGATEALDVIGMQVGRGVTIYDAGASTAMSDSAKLQINSTTRGFLKPRLTTAQKNAIVTPAAGLEIYDTDLNRPCFYNGSAWVTL